MQSPEAPEGASADGPTGSEKPPKEASTDDGSITGWERSVDCESDPDRAHDSVISVAEVTSDPGDEYAPIEFSDLSEGERTILRPVTEEGGYDTCDPGEAFGRFLDRVREYTTQQDEQMHVYLHRNGTHYRLYVERADQVYAY